MWACGSSLSCPKNCLFWTRVSNPCLISKFAAAISGTTIASSYPSVGAWSNSADYQPSYLWEVQQDSEELVVVVDVVVVDDELENECACTKIEI
ncbi:hypothetical protein Tco_1467528 [Tanacetum coccineum]